MLDHIRITPLAAESLGVRSMCTYVETPDVRILLDAGVSLCPSRFGLPPHPREYKAIIECRKDIMKAAASCDIVTVSHYHFDHHTPSYEDWVSQWTEETVTARQIYEGKVVLMKDPRESINYSQRRRGWLFGKTGGFYAKRTENADGKEFTFGDTSMKFSKPVFHGPEGTFLGWVLMATIECQNEKFMFAPDIQGPMSTATLELIIQERPQLLMLGGPPTYLVGFKVSEEQVNTALKNILWIVQNVPVTILEHHVLRDENWKEKLMDVFYTAYTFEHTVLTASESLRRPNNLLEASRKRLFKEDPPSKEFEKWMRLSEEERKRVRPPV